MELSSEAEQKHNLSLTSSKMICKKQVCAPLHCIHLSICVCIDIDRDRDADADSDGDADGDADAGIDGCRYNGWTAKTTGAPTTGLSCSVRTPAHHPAASVSTSALSSTR